jgi:hypothetical protein
MSLENATWLSGVLSLFLYPEGILSRAELRKGRRWEEGCGLGMRVGSGSGLVSLCGSDGYLGTSEGS